MSALNGLRVLDIGTVYAAPIAAMLLGDLGAEVIKIEHPRGDPARTHGHQVSGHGLWWKVIGRNKKAITLNLGVPEGADMLLDLARNADVIIENFRPGVLEKWGVGPEQLHRVNPRLVILRVTGFGQTGPYSQRRAFGTLIEAMSGLAHQTGTADGPPTLPPFGLADGVAAYAGACAVLAALYHRDSNAGTGQVIDLSLLEPLLGILGPGPSAYQQLGLVAERHGNSSPNNAPRNTYKTKDGRWVAISSSTTSVAERVMTLVGRQDVTTEAWFPSSSERAARRDALDAAVSSWIRERDFEDVIEQFQTSGAAIAPINNVEDLMKDPHVLEREVIITVDDEDLGELSMQNVPFRFSATPATIRSTGRRLGQDNAEVYRQLLGLQPTDIESLTGKGVI